MVKKALLVGITYSHLGIPELHLDQAHNDVNMVKGLLTGRFDYKEDDIVVMMDAPDLKNTTQWPSEENLVNAFKRLVDKAGNGDRFLFFFAGHGSQQECKDNSEKDGQDELIWPVDVVLEKDPIKAKKKFILDNDLKEYLVDPLEGKDDCRLVAVMDCCHSGTSLDLNNTEGDIPEPFSPTDPPGPPGPRSPTDSQPANKRVGPTLNLNHQAHNEKHHDGEHPGGPFIVSVSACLDPQVALDNKGGKLCSHLKKILDRSAGNLTCREVYNELCKRLGKDAEKARKKLGLEDKTKPQLCSSLPLKWVWDQPFEL